tara:strand:- start:999 stop:1340 length:342 start_codon:yes stop_codon:yes gene_type:complete
MDDDDVVTFARRMMVRLRAPTPWLVTRNIKPPKPQKLRAKTDIDLVRALLVTHPGGLTMRQVGQICGWSSSRANPPLYRLTQLGEAVMVDTGEMTQYRNVIHRYIAVVKDGER